MSKGAKAQKSETLFPLMDRAPPKGEGKEIGPQGHRSRMRGRVLTVGATSLADYELLEMLLFFAIPRRDTKQMAKQLMVDYGRLDRVFAASEEALFHSGVPYKAAQVLKFASYVSDHISVLAKPCQRPRLGKWKQLELYCHEHITLQAGAGVHALYLDGTNHLLFDEPVLENGYILDDEQISIVVRRALAVNATAVIIICSVADFEAVTVADLVPVAKKLIKATSLLSILVHDIAFFSKMGLVGLKRSGMI